MTNLLTFMIATLYNLLKNTKIKSRLFFTLILLSIPLFCLLFLTVITQNRAIRFGEKEIAGVAYNRLLIDLIKDYRNAIATLSINTVQPNYFELESTISSIERTEKYLVPLNNEHEDSLDTKESFNKLITEQEIFKKSVFSRNAIEAKKSAFKILEIVSKLNSSVGDTSNLILDPDLDSYYLMDITLIKIPLLMEVSTQIESILFQAIQENNLSEENQIKLFNFYSQFNTALDQTLNSFSVAYKYNEKVKNKIEPKVNIAFENINRYRDELKILSNPSNKTIDMEKILKFPSQLKNYNESILDLYLVTSDSQNELLDIRVSDFKFEQFLSISLVLLITGLTIFIQFVIVFSITNPLSEAVTKFELLAKGNLKHRIEYSGKDEIGALSNSINTFIEYLTNLLVVITKLSNESNIVFADISRMTGELSVSTENQAASTEESAAALEEISSSFGKIASSIENEARDISEIGKITDSVAISTQRASESIHNLGTVIDSSAREVKKGEVIISKTVESMNQIKSAADEISKIIILITEISKQIGLLALNASIEAARAGEHGRGFSVVADEISKLSLKTEESVKHIRSLIGSTNYSIKDGIVNVSTVVDVLRVVIEKINETNQKAKTVDEEISSQSTNIQFISNSHEKLESLSEQIETSTKEEKIAISQISQSMNRITAETQIISENIGQLKQSAEKISILSEELTKNVSKFEL